MTDLQRDQIPSDVNTVEKLHVWSGSMLKHLYPQVTLQETNNRVANAITEDEHFVDFEANPSLYLEVIRAAIPLDNNWRVRGQKWKSALSLGDASIPIEFQEN